MASKWKQIAVNVGALLGSVISDSERPELGEGGRLANDAAKLLEFENWLDATDTVDEGVKSTVWDILHTAENLDSDPGKQLEFLYGTVNQEASDDFAQNGYDLSDIDRLSIPLNPVVPPAPEAARTGSEAPSASSEADRPAASTAPPAEAPPSDAPPEPQPH